MLTSDLFPATWSIIPEKNSVPLIEWTPFMSRLPNKDDALSFPKGCGYGLICGKVSNVIALDIDCNDELVRVMSLIPGSDKMLAKFGSKGRTILFQYSGEKSHNWYKNGKLVAELLSDKRKTTVPPSKHRETGKEYIWLNEDQPTGLAALPDNFIPLMDTLFPKPIKKIVYPDFVEPEKVDLDEASEMLQYLWPDCSREEWVNIGMGLRAEFGDAAFSLWDAWSAKGTKYKANQTHSTWRSFNGAGVSIGSVIYYAQQGGWIRPAKSPILKTVDIDLKKTDITQKKEVIAHGLVSEIADWITATAYRPQPMLALSAALTFVGMLKGHKYSTSTGLRTNILALTIAPTASGKEHPQNCLWHLIKATGLDKHYMAEPCSGTALLKGLLNADRIGLLCIDELGRFIGNIANKNSGGFQREIIDYIIKSFSKANSFLIGRQYADDKKNPRIDIVNPHLCVLGSTVKERLVQSCTSEDAIDGFLNRWVLFESEERPDRQEKKMSIGSPPQSVLDAINKIIVSAPPAPFHNQEEPITHTVKLTPEAYSIMEQYSDTIETLLKKSQYPLDALYSRSCEHVAKIALIVSDNEYVRERDIEFAINVVTESNKLIASFTGLIADNEHEKNHIRVLEFIRKRGSVSNADFIRNTKYLNARIRKEIVGDLVGSGEIVLVESGKSFNLELAAG